LRTWARARKRSEHPWSAAGENLSVGGGWPASGEIFSVFLATMSEHPFVVRRDLVVLD
jgi:hypothetical protein